LSLVIFHFSFSIWSTLKSTLRTSRLPRQKWKLINGKWPMT